MSLHGNRGTPSRTGLIASATVLFMLSTPGEAAEWVTVARTERTEVFVQDASIARSGALVSVLTRQNFVEPQPAARKGKTYLSARNEYRIDCAARRLAYREIRAYAQPDLQGDVVQKTRIGEKNLKWMDAPGSTVFGELVDYTCQRAPSVSQSP
jgi:hypothetical protein